ncbi:hypothetical protein BDFG_07154, partial [Blastomyces dermatitidis ATCC 26199]
ADMFVFIHIKSLYIDRFTFTDDSELNIESLIENLKNVIIKKLSMLYVIRSLIFFSVSSITSFSTIFSQSFTLVSVSDSSASATSVPATLTSATSDFTVSAFIISSPHFKKILYRLNELYFSVFASVSEIILIKDDNITKTTLFYSQTSLVTFSLFSVRKVIYTLS